MSAQQVIDPFKRLLHDISKKLTEKEFQSLKHFAYGIPSNQIEQCERADNRCIILFDKLQKHDTISEDNLSWLHVVFREMNHKPVLDLIHEYEIKKFVSSYKVMLHRVAVEINDQVLEEFKLLCSEIDQSTLDGIKTPFDLFATLEKHGVISEDNVLFLEVVLHQLEENKLAKIVTCYKNKHSNDIECCRQERQPAQHGYHDIQDMQISKNVTHESISGIGQSLECPTHKQQSTITNNIQQADMVTSAETKLMNSNAGPVVPKLESLLSREETSVKHTSKEKKQQNMGIVKPLQNHLEMVRTPDVIFGHTEPKTRYPEANRENNNHREVLPGNSEVTSDCTQPKQVHEDGSSVGSKQTDDDWFVEHTPSKKDDNLQEINNPGQQQQLGMLVNAEKSAAVKEYLKRLHIDSPFSGSPSSSSVQVLETSQLSQEQSISRNEQSDISNMTLQQQQQPRPPIRLYDYQHELAAEALDGYNSIICAPAGSGKLLIAAYVFYVNHQKALKERKSFKALFPVHHHSTRCHVEETIRKMFEDEENNSLNVASTNEVKKLGNLLQHYDAVVLPAQVLADALMSKTVDLGQIQLLILNECHHLQSGQPYSRIMEEYSKQQSRLKPQVIGLITPTAIHEMGDCSSICDKFNCNRIMRVCHNMDQLLQHNPCPKQDQIFNTLSRDKNDLFVLSTTYLIKETEKLIPQITTRSSKEIPACGSEKYENWLVKMQTEPDFICKTLLVYNKALMYCDELRIEDVLPFMEQHFEKLQALQASGIGRKVLELYNSQVKELQEMAATETLEDNLKLQHLCKLLVELLIDHKTSKGVLFTKMEYSAERLVHYFRQDDLLKDIVKSALFRDTEEQHDILEEFRLASINLLVTTESCASVPHCDFMICYNIQETNFWSIHSYATKKSNCYVIGTVNTEREYANLSKEHKLLKDLRQIDMTAVDQTVTINSAGRR